MLKNDAAVPNPSALNYILKIIVSDSPNLRGTITEIQVNFLLLVTPTMKVAIVPDNSRN